MRQIAGRRLKIAKLLLLAVVPLLCALPTAQAIRHSAPVPALNSQPPRLNEEMAARSGSPVTCSLSWEYGGKK
jgi:hypothetical protein